MREKEREKGKRGREMGGGKKKKKKEKLANFINHFFIFKPDKSSMKQPKNSL